MTMSPKERTVVRAVIRALKSNARSCQFDMDALATSYPVPDNYSLARPKARAAMLLKALVESEP